MAIRLSTFSLANPIVDLANGRATVDFMRWINDNTKMIQNTITSDEQFTADIAFSIQQAGIAVTTAQAAQAAALAQTRESNLVNSYVDPSTVLSTSISTDMTTGIITVADHHRVYADGTRVAVTGGTLTGLALATYYYVTYIDAARTGGMVSYTATANSAAAAQGNDRHLVGSALTPGSSGTGGQASGTSGPGVPPRYDRFDETGLQIP